MENAEACCVEFRQAQPIELVHVVCQVVVHGIDILDNGAIEVAPVKLAASYICVVTLRAQRAEGSRLEVVRMVAPKTARLVHAAVV